MGVNRNEVRRRREARDLTMEAAAKRGQLKGGRQRWNDIESGRRPDPSATTVQALAKALDCSMEDLMESPAPDEKRAEKAPKRARRGGRK